MFLFVPGSRENVLLLKPKTVIVLFLSYKKKIVSEKAVIYSSNVCTRYRSTVFSHYDYYFFSPINLFTYDIREGGLWRGKTKLV